MKYNCYQHLLGYSREFQIRNLTSEKGKISDSEEIVQRIDLTTSFIPRGGFFWFCLCALLCRVFFF